MPDFRLTYFELCICSRYLSFTRTILFSGYRDAQCGWTLVYDTAADDAERRKVSKVGGKRPAPSSSSKSSPAQDLASKKKAQCLCIYAPRRGILEVHV